VRELAQVATALIAPRRYASIPRRRASEAARTIRRASAVSYIVWSARPLGHPAIMDPPAPPRQARLLALDPKPQPSALRM
jgi:hypothetical protein